METPIGGEPETMETFVSAGRQCNEPNAEAYLDKMLRLLQADGVRFPNNKVDQVFAAGADPAAEFLHAEGEWMAQRQGAYDVWRYRSGRSSAR